MQIARTSALVCQTPSIDHPRRPPMKLKLLVAALAAAFSAAAFAEGWTNTPSSTAAQGNPPATAPAGSQVDPSTAPGTATGKDRTQVRKDRQARKERKHDSATGATTTDKENDHTKRMDSTSGSTAAPVTGGATATAPAS